MYIKLTRLDDTPIWINAAFIVTIEPRKQGGSIVVPIGDGLDYDVRESADQVLALLGDAPPATVVPVPVSQALSLKPVDAPAEAPSEVADKKAEVEHAKQPAPRRAKTTASASAKATARKTKANAKAVKNTVAELSDDQIERLKKMAPGSMRKLLNTLEIQFKVSDAKAVIAWLQQCNLIAVERDHILWSANAAEATDVSPSV